MHRCEQTVHLIDCIDSEAGAEGVRTIYSQAMGHESDQNNSEDNQVEVVAVAAHKHRKNSEHTSHSNLLAGLGRERVEGVVAYCTWKIW